jgi:putative ABC transport system permease protein
LHSKIEPLAITVNTNSIDYALIRLASGDIPEGIKTVQSAWQKIYPNYPFEYHFLDQALETNYQNERTTRTLIQIFTILALLIACLGLFGLASFTAEQRTKEIGIRKVLGASIPSVVFLLSKEFTRWVLLANLTAWPVAYLLMKSWLQKFAYRMDLGMNIFVISGLLAFGIALLTVSFQSIKMVLANPAQALRYE